MKKASLFFAIGTWLIIITGPLHMVAHLLGKTRVLSASDQLQVIHLMQTVLFDFGGIQRTLAEIKDGFSLVISVICLMAGSLNYLIWRHGRHILPLFKGAAIFSVACCLLVFIISVQYLILPPVILFGTASLAYFGALLLAGKQTVPEK